MSQNGWENGRRVYSLNVSRYLRYIPLPVVLIGVYAKAPVMGKDFQDLLSCGVNEFETKLLLFSDCSSN